VLLVATLVHTTDLTSLNTVLFVLRVSSKWFLHSKLKFVTVDQAKTHDFMQCTRNTTESYHRLQSSAFVVPYPVSPTTDGDAIRHKTPKNRSAALQVDIQYDTRGGLD
jgi:hypothetical protein